MSSTAVSEHPPLLQSRPFVWVCLAGLLYAAAYCLWYASTPMGVHPVLDGKENLQLANAITEGRLPAEPFYRAPLYPLLISGGIGLGLPESLWPDLARLINLLAWSMSVFLAGRLAGRLWASERAAIAAAALWAFYPVGLFFLGDPLDVTLATALLLAGLDRAVAFLKTASPQAALASGFLLVLGALARPQLWTVVVVAPVAMLAISMIYRRGEGAASGGPAKRPPRWPIALFLVGGAMPAVMLGLYNQKLSGDFTFMPTQGAFNLWAANKPGAHGKYFAQEIEVFQREDHQNPARVEAIYHYMRDRGVDASVDYQEINQYWRERTRAMIVEDPAAWIGRLLRKAYYLLNRYEQYNNKTYSVHRELTPLLALNPLGWGLLLVAAAPLLVLGRKNPLIFWLMLSAGLAYAGGLLLTYVSARFRLPLAPMLAVLASGWAAAPWRAAPRWRCWTGAGLGALAGLAAFTTGFGVREPPTAAQDYLLLGYAALDSGRDQAALEWAGRGMTVDDDRLALRELAVVAQFNLDLAVLLETGELPPGDERDHRLAEARRLAQYSPRVNYITGVYEWWSGQTPLARERWLAGITTGGDVNQDPLAAYLYTHATKDQAALPGKVKVALARIPPNRRQPMLQVAVAPFRGEALNSESAQILDERLELIFGP